MLFLEPLYRYLEAHFADKINHFPLIRLIMYSVDHATVLFLFWLVAWSIYIIVAKKRGKTIYWRRELYRNIFVFYILLLFQLTVFRNNVTIFSVTLVEHPLSDISWIPFQDSIKLFYGDSLFAAYYNVFGNILWFIPLGLFIGMLNQDKRAFVKTLLAGAAVSLTIESLQFAFFTGVTHIDDVLLNIIGSACGYGLYRLFFALQVWRVQRRSMYNQSNDL